MISFLIIILLIFVLFLVSFEMNRYAPLGTIDYTGFTQGYLQCGGYFIEALLDSRSFSDIPNPYTLFSDAFALLIR